MYQPTPQERAALHAAGDDARYRYFLHKVADWDEAWGLYTGDGAVVLADDADSRAVPLWPAAAYAAAAATGEWSGAEVRRLSCTELLERWLPEVAGAGLTVAAFPNADGRAAVLSPEALTADLQSALADYD